MSDQKRRKVEEDSRERKAQSDPKTDLKDEWDTFEREIESLSHKNVAHTTQDVVVEAAPTVFADGEETAPESTEQADTSAGKEDDRKYEIESAKARIYEEIQKQKKLYDKVDTLKKAIKERQYKTVLSHIADSEQKEEREVDSFLPEEAHPDSKSIEHTDSDSESEEPNQKPSKKPAVFDDWD